MKTASFLFTAFLLFVLLSSCNHLPRNRPVVHIGDTVANGIVFYVDDSRQHGMVCGLADLGTAPWDTTIFDVKNYDLYNPPFVGSTDTAFGAGAANTITIINRIGNPSTRLHFAATARKMLVAPGRCHRKQNSGSCTPI